jgi:hypothetical protein
MENLWGCIILAFAEEWSQVLLAHELQREGNNVTPNGLQLLHRVSIC